MPMRTDAIFYIFFPQRLYREVSCDSESFADFVVEYVVHIHIAVIYTFHLTFGERSAVYFGLDLRLSYLVN